MLRRWIGGASPGAWEDGGGNGRDLNEEGEVWEVYILAASKEEVECAWRTSAGVTSFL